MYCYNRLRGQPILFSQERLGKNGKPFMVLKFETLYSGAELTQEHVDRLFSSQLEREIGDPRVSNRVMALMRRSGLNEIPQIINVLKGQMSIVGPRPLSPDYLNLAKERFPELLREWKETALKFKPGVLGVSPLKTRRIPIQQFDKIAFADIRYCNEATFWRDMSVIAEVFVAIVKGS